MVVIVIVVTFLEVEDESGLIPDHTISPSRCGGK